jgi:hypothetical protein
MAAMEALRAALAASAPPLDVERLGDGPAIGALTPKQVRILDNRHHRVKDGHLCACGSVWAHCAVHRLIVTLDALRAYADGISEASEPPRPEQDATPTGSSSRGRADLDVERLAQVFAVMRAEGGACWPNYTHSGLETIEQRFARAYAEQDATPEGEA